MRLTSWVFLLGVAVSVVRGGWHHHHLLHQLLPYLLVQQLTNPGHRIVVPLVIPIPVGIFKRLSRRGSYRVHESTPTEIYIQSTGGSHGNKCYDNFCDFGDSGGGEKIWRL